MAEATPPTSPTFVDNPRKTNLLPDALGGTTVNVGSGAGDLLTALGGTTGKAGLTPALNADGSHRGNTYVVPAGPTYNGLTLPTTNNAATGWTCIKSAGSLPAVGTRVNDTTHPAQMFKLRSSGAGGARALVVPQFASGYRIIGMDAGHPNGATQTNLVEVQGCNRVGIERSYLHNHPDCTVLTHGLWIDDTAWFQLYDSLVKDIKALNNETQAIYLKHTEITHLENNELQGSTENVLLDDQYSGVACRDTVILRNLLSKPLSWAKFLMDGVTPNPVWDEVVDAQGDPWTVKNSFEIKWALRVLFEGNTIENCWLAQQDGTAIKISSGSSGTIGQSIQDVMMRYNKFINVRKAFTSTFSAGALPPPDGSASVCQRVAFLHNLILGCDERFALINKAAKDLWIEHNTAVPMARTDSDAIQLQYTAGQFDFPRLTIRRNIIGHNVFGLRRTEFGASAGDWTDAWANSELGLQSSPTAGRDFRENAWMGNAHHGPAASGVIAGFTKFTNETAAGVNLTTGILASNSPLKAGAVNGGSDAKDIGVDHAALALALAGTPSVPSSTFSPLQTQDTLTVVFTNTSSGAPTTHLWTLYQLGSQTAVLDTQTTLNASFTYAVQGTYFARYQGTNAQGQGNSGLIAFTVAPVTPSAPTITITSPTSAATFATSSPTIILGGTATDVSTVSWVNTTTEVGDVATGTNSWTTPAITLVEGDNVIPVTGTGPTEPAAQDTITVTYTPVAPVILDPPQLMRGFGPTRGVAGTDKAVLALTASAAARTYFLVARRGVAVAANPRMFDKGPSGTEIFYFASASGTYRFSRLFAVGRSYWSIPAPPLDDVRRGICIRYNSSSYTNLPAINIDHVAQVVSWVQSASNSAAVSNAEAFVLGNAANGTLGWEGDLGPMLVFDRIITDAEEITLLEGGDPATLPGGPPVDGYLDPPEVSEAGVTLTGTVIQDYGAAPAPPTVLLEVISGNPATGEAYQIEAITTGTVDRVEFTIDAGSIITRTVAPYLLFAAPQLLGPGPHTIEASVFDSPGGIADDTATKDVTEPVTETGTGAWLVDQTLCARIPTAISYKVDLDGGATHVTVLQPATGDPRTSFPFLGADRDLTIGITPVFAAGDGVRMAVRPRRYTDPSATAIEGLKEVSRAYDGTTWAPVFVWVPKPDATFYRFWLDGSLGDPIPIPPTGKPSTGVSFTGTDVEKTIWVAAVYAGDVEGPRAGMKQRYVAPAAQAPVGWQEHSRTFTP